jgi:hypothetical protein
MYCPLANDWHDLRWMVPPDYYDTWRTWYGWVHRNTTWTCWEQGELLVIGPARWGSQRLSGTVCLFLLMASRRNNQCLVYTQWGKEEVVSAYRLTPIELCEPITNTNNTWVAKYQLV